MLYECLWFIISLNASSYELLAQNLCFFYPDLPIIDALLVKTFEELALHMSDQQDFLMEKLDEVRSQFSGHYMTQMNKKLVTENKELRAKLEKSLTQKIENMIKSETAAAEALHLDSLKEQVKSH